MKYLTVKEAAKVYQTSIPTIYRLLKSRKLDAIKMGKRWLIRPEETWENNQVTENLLKNALADFVNDVADECTYLSGNIECPEVEFYPDKLAHTIDRYTDLLQKLITWRGGEK